jgi:metal-sulfur cluster biosynthetic enzyme
MDKDNANPAILNPSDLPSRRSALNQTTTSHTSLFDGLVPSYPHYDSLFASTLTSASSAPLPTNLSDDDDNTDENEDDDREEIDEQEIFDLISTISDPEHPLSLGSLAVVSLPDIFILPPSSAKSRISTVRVLVTPTITHCSLATVIGLGVRVRLEQSLPPRYRIDVRIKEGTHASDEATNKQLGDKERVAAAMENGTLVGVIQKMLSTCE